jgi:hypothetical protein
LVDFVPFPDLGVFNVVRSEEMHVCISPHPQVFVPLQTLSAFSKLGDLLSQLQ